MKCCLPVRSALSGILLFSFSWMPLPAYAADEGTYTIQDSVQEVRMVFAATDGEGNPIKSLRSSDVAVADDGWIVREFRSFRQTADMPLDLVLLLDVSSSVDSGLPETIAGIESFLAGTSWREGDRITLLVFGGSEPQLVCLRNCRAADITPKIKSLWGDRRATLETPLYDALLQAAVVLRQDRDPELRPAIILISDGEDTISKIGFGDALRSAQKLEAPIYAVNSCTARRANPEGDAVLRQLAAGTGGLSFGGREKLTPVLSEVLEDLRSRYILTYTPPMERRGTHLVRLVPTGNPGLRFRSRRYYEHE